MKLRAGSDDEINELNESVYPKAKQPKSKKNTIRIKIIMKTMVIERSTVLEIPKDSMVENTVLSIKYQIDV